MDKSLTLLNRQDMLLRHMFVIFFITLVSLTSRAQCPPIVTAIPASASVCAGDSVQMVCSPATGTTWQWYLNGTAIPGATSSTYYGLANGNYTVITGGCGLPSNAINVILKPIPLITISSSALTLCNGQQVTLNVNTGVNVNWVWLQPASLLGTNTTPVTQTLTNTTTFQVVGVDQTTNCSNTYTLVIPVVPILLPGSIQADAEVCPGGTPPLITGPPATGGSGTYIYQWEISTTSASAGFSPIPGATGQNYQPGAISVNTWFRRSVSSLPCPDEYTNTVMVQVNLAPVGNNTTRNRCSGSNVNYTPTSSMAGSTYTWTGSVTSGTASGVSATGSGIINDILTLPAGSTTTATVTYVITPTGPAPTFCVGPTFNLVVTVFPIPLITNPILTQSICAGLTTTPVSLQSNLANTTFSWTATATPGISGFTPAGSGNIPAMTLFSSLTIPGTVTYTVVPQGPAPTNCTGPSVSYVITINPAPSVTNNPLQQTICSNGNTTLVTLTSNIGATSFSWTAAAAPAGITGFAPSGTNTIPVQTIVNPNTTQGVVTYTIVPSGIVNGCAGVPTDYRVFVNPIPVVTATPASEIICSGQTTNISLTSSVSNTTFSWTASGPGSLTGFGSGSGNTIAQTISNTSNAPHNVTYTVTPVSLGCTGAPITVVVTVNPYNAVTALPLSQTICSGTSLNMNLTATLPGTNFSWTVSGVGVTGYSNGSGNLISQILTNTTTIPRNVIYLVTGFINGCVTATTPYTVTVNPAPVLTNIPLTATRCSGNVFNLAFSSNVAGSTYTWTANGTPGTSGFSNGSGLSINQTLTNSTNLPGTVTYTITPRANGCDGVPTAYTVTVNPIPDVIFSLGSQTICSGTPTSVVLLSSSVSGTTYTWSATPSGAGITGYTSSGNSDIPSQVINSSLTVPGSVTYNVIPVSNGCTGPSNNHVVIINPLPAVTNSPMSQSICSGTSSANVNLLSNVANTTYSWIATPSSPSITGYQPSGSSTIPPQTLHNSSLIPGTVTYQIIPTSNTIPACQGTAINYVTTVNPIPSVTSNLISAVCSDQPFTYTITSDIPSATFSWSRASVAGISNPPANGFTSTIGEILTNLTTNDIVVTYIITPIGPAPTFCTGTPVSLAVTVRALPQVNAGPDLTIPFGTSTTITGTTSGGTGSLSYTWTPNTYIASGASTLAPHTINLNATRSFTLNVTDAAGCSSTDNMTVFITGTALASVPTAVPASICLGQNSVINANATGGSGTYTYSWTSAPAGFISTASIILVSPIVNTVYTVVVDDGFNSVTSSVAVTVNALPVQYNLTGGGNYCIGGVGVVVGLAGSQSGVTYQLFNNGNPVGTPVLGNGGSLSFGNQTLAGNYTVVATRVATGCTLDMGSSVSVAINTLPIADAGVDQTIPYGTSTTLNGSVSGGFGLMNYSWSPLSFIAVGPNTPAPLTTNLYSNTTFSLTVTDANGCVGSDIMSVSLSGSAINVVASATASQICADTTQTQLIATVSGGSGIYSFSWTCTPPGSPVWSSIQQNPMVSPDVTTTYTVTANDGFNTAIASTTIVVNPLPLVFSVMGGGSYCFGYPGVPIGLSGSEINVDYQLLRGGIPDGPPVTGTGNPISFGNRTAAFNYTVLATNNLTGCINQMNGSASIMIIAPPNAYLVTGGGSYPFGGIGREVGLSYGDAGISYQLQCNNIPVGAPVVGTSNPINFGYQTIAGTYTVVATDLLTGCTANMNGSVNITILPLPVSYRVVGGGTICAGEPGLPVGLTGSEIGVDYQLIFNGFPQGSLVAGTNLPLTWGPFTIAGLYEIRGINSSNGASQMMDDSAVIVVNPLPTIYTINPTGPQCPGTIIRLNGSEAGLKYYLLYNGITVDSLTGTGVVGFLDFGPQVINGSYTIKAVNPVTGCEAMMNGSTYINIAPQIYNVIPAGILCPGQVITLTGSQVGVNYQLRWNGTFDLGAPVTGTGSAIALGNAGLPGVYSAVAIDASTNCVSFMSDSATLYPDPTAFTIVPDGQACEGDEITLNGSQLGVDYVLILDNAIHLDTISGNGSAINFGPQWTEGDYTILAIDQFSYCQYQMNGVSIFNDSPIQYNLLPAGLQCAGTTIGLSGSQIDVSYQLIYNGSFNVGSPVAGTGSPITFGSQNLIGVYTIRAVNDITGCNSIMLDSTILDAIPMPFLITPDANACAGTNILLGGSELNVNYILILNGSVNIDTIAGTGNILDFGPQSISGAYTVIAYNPVTFCNLQMPGSTIIETAPALYTITPAGIACQGVIIGLDNSETGISYQLRWNGSTNIGAPVIGTGAAISFGVQNLVGTYTVIATAGNNCVSVMNGSVIVNPLPVAYTVTPAGNNCANTAIGINGSEINVNYVLILNGAIHVDTIAGTGTALSFGPQITDGTYTVIAYNSVTNCQMAMNGSSVIDIAPLVYNITPAGIACQGVIVGLDNSETGISYQLRWNGSTNIGSPVIGTGAAISFGVQNLVGTYTVIATASNNCVSVMKGSVIVNPLPVAFTVTPAGNNCASTAIGINGSEINVNYVLILNGAIHVDTIAGTGTTLSFGPQITDGTYTVIAYNSVTNCQMAMNGSSVIDIAPLVYNITPAGIACQGVIVGMDNSETGISYQLRWNGSTNIGSPVIGTGAAISFGVQNLVGTYTVIATASNNCVSVMNGSVIVNPLPVAFTVTPAGNNCASTAIGINGSEINVNYVLILNGAIHVDTIAGTGTAVSFGPQITDGTYTVIAYNSVTNCQIAMNGSSVIDIAPLIYNVTPAGINCPGTIVGLDDSELNVTYQLRRDGITNVGAPITGTGSPINFGAVSIPGTYSIVATSSINGCAIIQNGSTVIFPSPLNYSIVPQGVQCAGTSISLNGSQPGIDYVLVLDNAFNLDTITGNGAVINFGPQLITGNYTIIAIGGATTCQSTMNGSVQLMANPTAFNVTPAGLFCITTIVGLDGSETGVDYTLYKNGINTGNTISGTGNAISFGTQSFGDYTINATNTANGCNSFMTGTVQISTPPQVNAGSDITVCSTQNVTLTATVSYGSTSTWTSSGNGVFDDMNNLNATYTLGSIDIASGSVQLILTSLGTGGCILSQSSDTLIITIDQPATANAGADIEVCSSSDFTITGASATNYNSVSWSTTGTGTFVNGNTLMPTYNPSVSDISAGSVSLTLTITGNSPCNNVITDACTMNFHPFVTVNAGNDGVICSDHNFTITTATATNYQSLTWSSTGTGTFTAGNTLAATYIPSAADQTTGTVEIILTAISAVPCNVTISDTLTLQIISAPVADAGADVSVCENTSLIISDATVSNSVSIQWGTSGTGTFSNSTILNPVYNPSPADITAGTIILTLTVTGDPLCNVVTDSKVVTFILNPTVNAGADANICTTSYTLSGATASNCASILWTVQSGTGMLVNSTTLTPAYTPSPADILSGSVVLLLTGTPINPCVNNPTDFVILTIDQIPTANAGADASLCDNSSYTVADASASMYSNLLWASNGSGILINSTTLNPSYTPSAADILAGSVVLTFTASNSGCGSVSDSKVLNFVNHTTSNAGPDLSVCAGSSITIGGATASAYSTIYWTTTGSGTFTLGNTISPTYMPSAADIAAGSVGLTLNAVSITPCNNILSDQLALTIKSLPIVNAGSDALICSTDIYLNNDATVLNGSSYIWTTSGTGVFSDANNLVNTYTPSTSDLAVGNVVLTLTVTNNAPCSDVSDDKVITFMAGPTANAGPGTTICNSCTYTANSASVQNASTVQWLTSGSGSFNNALMVNTTYTPSPTDLANGSVVLSLIAYSTPPCTQVIDTMTLNFNDNPGVGFTWGTACDGQPVQFSVDPIVTNISTIVSWFWNFDDGTTSTLMNPTHQFSALGEYDVTLTAIDNTGSAMVVLHKVTVTELPVAFFKFNEPGCSNVPVLLTDLSHTLYGYIAEWIWNYGDGTDNDTIQFPDEPNIAHLFSGPGTYNVTLTVTNSFGCIDAVTIPVDLIEAPVANFQYTNECAGTETSFVDASYANGPGNTVQYYWNFGDPVTGANNTSNLKDATHIFSQPGIYQVMHVVQNFNSCSDTIIKPVTIHTPVPVDFVYDFTCLNRTTNFGPDLTVMNVADIVSWAWDFGDGVTDFQQNTQHVYSNPGSYEVTLTVTDIRGCTASKKRTVVVNQLPVAMFTTPQILCANSPVHFDDASNAYAGFIASWTWEFGDGNTTTINHPANPDIDHTYSAPGTYQVKLTIISSDSCSAQAIQTIVVSPAPTSNFDFESSCEDIPVQFNDLTQTGGTGVINSWVWHFGDDASGYNNTSILQNPVHTFAVSGTYQVSLTTTTANGCTSTVIKTVTISPAPFVDFSYDNHCVNTEIQFSPSAAVNIAAVATWHWSFGDGLYSAIPNPQHTYSTPGNYTVKLTITNTSGCSNSFTKIITIVPVPIANFTTSSPACSQQKVDFTNLSTAPVGYIVRWEYNFGDGITTVVRYPSNPSISHTYSTYGNFTATLTVVTNDSCSATTSRNVTILQSPLANFANNGSCAGQQVQFTDLSQGNIISWQWNFGDSGSGSANSSTLQNPSHTFQQGGNYQVILQVNNSNGCSDTIIRNLAILPKPVVDFSFNNGCAADTVHFNSSNYVNVANTVTWLWQFGDNNTSSVADPHHVYATPGTYTVTLAITNQSGCTNVKTRQVQVTTAPVALFTSNAPACAGKVVHFTNSSSTPNGVISSWHWNFGDGTNTTINAPANPNVNHTYTIAGNYDVTLTIHTSTGCEAYYTTSVTIHSAPVSAFSSIGTCSGQPTFFTDLSQSGSGSTIVSWNWNFGDEVSGINNISGLQNPQHTFNNPGNYTVSLTTENASGCSHIVTQVIAITQKPGVDFIVPSICESIPVTFEADPASTNIGQVASYLWNFGDGTPNSTQAAPLHMYTQTGTYTITLTITNTTGCENSVSHTITVHSQPVASFASTGNCVASIAQFTDQSYNPDGGQIVTWAWDFGVSTSSNDTSSLQNPSFVYTTQGTYNVTLTVTTESGCTDVFVKPLNVIAGPEAKFSYIAEACHNGSVIFTDESEAQQSLITSWYWEFTPGHYSTLQNPVHVFGGSDTCYNVKLVVTNTNGCTDTIIKEVCIPSGLEVTFDYTQTCQGEITWFTPTLVSPEGGSIEFYNWNFGDPESGINNISTLENPSHKFSNPGTYTVSLKATDVNNCFTTKYMTIIVDPLPVAAFTNIGGICDSLVVFKNTTTAAPLARWIWNFGDGSIDTIDAPANPNINHYYPYPGVFDITLITESIAGCVDTITKTIRRTPCINAQIATVDTIVCQKRSMRFNETSTCEAPIASWQWFFGDNTSVVYTSPQPFIEHTYAVAGNYEVKMVVATQMVGGMVTDTATSQVSVKPAAKAAYKWQDVCFGAKTVFENRTTPNNTTITGYKWDFADPASVNDTSSKKNAEYRYDMYGQYNVKLVVTNTLGCTDTIINKVNIFQKPAADFDWNSSCESKPVYFADNSDSTSSAIAKWNWVFSQGGEILGASTNQDCSYNFGNAGIYYAFLKVTDRNGCTDTIRKDVAINSSPVAAFSIIDNYDNKQGQIKINNGTINASNYEWDFGNGKTAYTANPVATFDHEGDYIIKLITWNGQNCADTMSMAYSFIYKGLYVPNAFNPGHVNKEVALFKPKGTNLKLYNIGVYDRWGNLLWSSNKIDSKGSPLEAWDGKLHGEVLPQGVYVWKIQAQFRDGDYWNGQNVGNNTNLTETQSGTVTLIR